LDEILVNAISGMQSLIKSKKSLETKASGMKLGTALTSIVTRRPVIWCVVGDQECSHPGLKSGREVVTRYLKFHPIARESKGSIDRMLQNTRSGSSQ
jgi:hypothetical protein